MHKPQHKDIGEVRQDLRRLEYLLASLPNDVEALKAHKPHESFLGELGDLLVRIGNYLNTYSCCVDKLEEKGCFGFVGKHSSIEAHILCVHPAVQLDCECYP